MKPAAIVILRLGLASLLAGGAHGAWAQGADASSPQRPAGASPSPWPAAGQLEIEDASLPPRADGAATSGTKLIFSEQWGALGGVDAYVATRDRDPLRASNTLYTTVTLRRSFLISPQTAVGVELGAASPTAKDPMGSGRTDYGGNTIFTKDIFFSQDIGPVHLDANAKSTRLGPWSSGEGGHHGGLSATLSSPALDRWSATAEVSRARRPGVGSTAQFLLAAGYSPSKRVTIDIGAARGLNGPSSGWSLFCGMVTPLTQLWPEWH